MKITIRNLAVVKKAEVEIGGLTVLCGKNNSGKTYVTHAVFGMLDYLHRTALSSVEKLIGKAEREGDLKFGDDDLRRIIQEGVDAKCKTADAILPEILAADSERVRGASLSIGLSTPVVGRGKFRRVSVYPNYGLQYSGDGTVGGQFSINVVAPEQMKTSDDKKEISAAKCMLRNDLAVQIQSVYLPRVFVCSTERTGAAIFQKELDFTRSRLIDYIKGEQGHKMPRLDLIGQFTAEYPLAVRNDVDFVREFPVRCERKGRWAARHGRLLSEFSDIVGGSYVSSESGVRFVPKASAEGDVKLRMSESSSSVRALMDLAGYLKCFACDGDLLIIDEPEMNLHPENQRRLARFLAELVNSGLNVFITTHSDYIVKEFGLLLMMKSESARKRGIAKRNGYGESSLLSVDRVHFYQTEDDPDDQAKRIVSPVRVTQEEGIDKSSFDSTIDSMNRLFDELYWEG